MRMPSIGSHLDYVTLRPPIGAYVRNAVMCRRCGGGDMLARLGNVLYWLGCIAAVVIVGFAGIVYFSEGQRPSDLPVVVVLGVIAAVAWLIGRACRYVLAGN